jgi:uncharacterized pyridoxamine 5'-phosphate oxidase family protein
VIEVYRFLKKCGIYLLAMVDGGIPKLYPADTINIYEHRLYIQTESEGPSRQIISNSKISISAVRGNEWIHVDAVAVNDDRIEAKKILVNFDPKTCNGLQLFYLQNAVATIERLHVDKKMICF